MSSFSNGRNLQVKTFASESRASLVETPLDIILYQPFHWAKLGKGPPFGSVSCIFCALLLCSSLFRCAPKIWWNFKIFLPRQLFKWIKTRFDIFVAGKCLNEWYNNFFQTVLASKTYLFKKLNLSNWMLLSLAKFNLISSWELWKHMTLVFFGKGTYEVMGMPYWPWLHFTQSLKAVCNSIYSG